MADLQEQLESLVHEVAAYNAHSKGIAAPKRVGVFREPEINGRTVPRDPFRFPLGVVNGDYAAAVVPDSCEPPPHLIRFKESNFVDTSTHTRFNLRPPDGAAKPDMLRTSCQSPVRYKGTLASNTPQRLPHETKEKPVENLGPGDIPWDTCPQGQGLGTFINCTPASKSLAPARDPSRFSQPFAACERPDPAAASRTAGSGILYKPGMPDFAVWHRCGFSTTAQLRDIKAETWGATTREPRDPNAAPPQRVVPEFDKRGFPADVSRQAERSLIRGSDNWVGGGATCARPSTSCTPTATYRGRDVQQRAKTAGTGLRRTAAVPKDSRTFHRTYGRQGVVKLDRQMGTEDRSGLRADVGQSYPDSAAMGPGTHEPSIEYRHLKRAQTAPAQSSWGAQKLQPLVRVRAVMQVREARREYQEEQRRAQLKALSAVAMSRVCSKQGDMLAWHGAPPELCREECVARKAIIARVES